ncbi:MAG: aminotransferase class V-fold PLP-dependent enzyme [Caldilineaceae bacterium]|nr:aminotransferase class V-fold PLP-dependent enzyme [Caldilineaceae bacterium]
MLTEETRQHSFPSLSQMTYLNSAAEGIPPLEVHAALDQYFRDKQLGMDGREHHAAQYESVKALTAQLYGLSRDEIGICSCTSEAYNLASLALQLQPGDEVVINELDFPAGATPWLQPSSPATVRVWRACAGALHVEDLIPLLSSKTRLVTLSLVSFFNGYTVSLPPVVEAIRHHSNALLAVDVTQALGRLPLDLAGVDLVVSSTHKWILASHGGGLVGVPSAHAKEWTVPAGGWFNLQDPFGPDRFERAQSKEGAASFGVGMPNYPAIYAIRAGLEYILHVGVENIYAATEPLVQTCLDTLRRLPVEMLTPANASANQLAGIIAFRHPAMDTIQRHLHSQNIHVMAQAGRMRVAIHGYNTQADIERFLSALTGALRHVATA